MSLLPEMVIFFSRTPNLLLGNKRKNSFSNISFFMRREIKYSRTVSYADALSQPITPFLFLKGPSKVPNTGHLRAHGIWEMPGALESLSLGCFPSVI